MHRTYICLICLVTTLCLDPIAFELMLLCLSLVYYYLNFIDIQRLNNDIFEVTNKD